MPVDFHYSADLLELGLFDNGEGLAEGLLDASDEAPVLIVVDLLSQIEVELVELDLVALELLRGCFFVVHPVGVVSMHCVVHELLDEAVGDTQDERRVDVAQLVVPEQLANTLDGLVELVGLDGEENVVVPNLPRLAVDLESLLAASDGLEVLLVSDIAVSHVGPGLYLAVVDGHHLAEGEDGVLGVLHPHVGTAHSEPTLGEELVQGQLLLETFDGLVELLLVEVVLTQTAHGLGAAVIALLPRSFEPGVVSLHLAHEAHQVIFLELELRLHEVFGHFNGLLLATSHEEALHGLVEHANRFQQLVSTHKDADLLIVLCELLLDAPAHGVEGREHQVHFV
mmetsp:Transcript_32157/g.49177  ORF Transcript_32157/g.49177 Transcript_32157/m.49177 type:complete len:340 (+) Transcript_32157:193-1212(+)